MAKIRTALILGGGLAGLTCADALARAGVQVTVLEQLDEVGGLARNVEFAGMRFDLGGHRILTDNPRIRAWFDDLLGGRRREVSRHSRILLGGRYFDYPLRATNALSGFGAREATRILADFAASSLRRGISDASDLSLEDWIVKRFGRRLFEVYFCPYSVKVWGLPCDQISAEWAAQRIQLMSLTDAVWQAFRGGRKPKTYAGTFWYPEGGIGVLAHALADRIQAAGGSVVTGRGVRQIVIRHNRILHVRTDAGTHAADAVISTIPLTLLGQLVGAPADALGELGYRSLRCVFLAIDQPKVSDDTWLYFPEPDVAFGRAHEPRNWDPGMAPAGQTSLCLEIFCNPDDYLWRLEEKGVVARCVADLARLGLVAADRVRGGGSLRVPNAYPVFRVGFRRPLRVVLDRVAEIDGLHVLGRTGAYRYENMDQVAAAALTLADNLVRG